MDATRAGPFSDRRGRPSVCPPATEQESDPVAVRRTGGAPPLSRSERTNEPRRNHMTTHTNDTHDTHDTHDTKHANHAKLVEALQSKSLRTLLPELTSYAAGVMRSARAGGRGRPRGGPAPHDIV